LVLNEVNERARGVLLGALDEDDRFVGYFVDVTGVDLLLAFLFHFRPGEVDVELLAFDGAHGPDCLTTLCFNILPDQVLGKFDCHGPIRNSTAERIVLVRAMAGSRQSSAGSISPSEPGVPSGSRSGSAPIDVTFTLAIL
jgi:hypothetical protein